MSERAVRRGLDSRAYPPAAPRPADRADGPRVANGARPVPGDWLAPLATVMKLTALEWRIAVLVMARGPISVFALAKALRLNYTLAKRGARSLATWNIVTRSPAGLVFQPNAAAWEEGTHAAPLAPMPTRRGPSKASTTGTGSNRPTGGPDREFVLPPPARIDDEEESTLNR